MASRRKYRIFGFSTETQMSSGRPVIGGSIMASYGDEAVEKYLAKYPVYAKRCDLWISISDSNINKIASNREGEVHVM